MPSHKASSISPTFEECELQTATYPNALCSPPDDAKQVATDWLNSFNSALHTEQLKVLHKILFLESYWRDQLALGWNFHTLRGPESIIKFLEQHSFASKLGPFRLNDDMAHRKPRWTAIDCHCNIMCVVAFLKFETDIGIGDGVVRLMQDAEDGIWKGFTLFTAMVELKGHQQGTKFQRPLNSTHLSSKETVNLLQNHDAFNGCHDNDQPAVIIVGAGHCGLLSAARLQLLRISCMVIDIEKRIGDNWRNRYRNLVLHDPIWYNHFPYLPFPENWAVFTPKDDVADWLEIYAQALKLNVRTSTRIEKTVWRNGRWEVSLLHELANGGSESSTLFPRHIIQATGMAGEPKIPCIPGMDSFQGLIRHSSVFRGASPNGKGKHAVVIGSCNSAHDVAQDYYNQGWKVTMIQRSSTIVDLSVYDEGKGFYREDGLPTRDADLLTQSIPNAVLKRNEIEVTESMRVANRDFFGRLEARGFKLNWGPDGSGRKIQYLLRGGGYYINTGTSSLIASGAIRTISAYNVTCIAPHAVQVSTKHEFSNITSLSDARSTGPMTETMDIPTDEIVLCTGYGIPHTKTRSIFGDAIADNLSQVCGLDKEGEVRGLWRYSGVNGFWVVGGNFKSARWGIEALGVQIKALETGICHWNDFTTEG